jgi:hypothetical protein
MSTTERPWNLRESYLFDRPSSRRSSGRRRGDLRHPRLRRQAALPHFDDLLFLGASISRYPLEGYRENVRDRRRARDALREEPLELRSRSRSRA